MATHSSILAWKIPQTEEPEGLQPMGSQRVRHRLSHLNNNYHRSPNWLLPRGNSLTSLSLEFFIWKVGLRAARDLTGLR